MLGGDGWDSVQLWELGGDSLNGDFISNHYSVDDPSPAIQKFVANYKARNGEVPDALAALGYDAMSVLADAIKRSGTTEGPQLKDAIAATKNFVGVTGTISLDKDRNAVKPAVVLKLQDKKYIYQETIYPEGMTAPTTAASPAAASKAPAGPAAPAKAEPAAAQPAAKEPAKSPK
jgi:branched-chain amino acid transport system substrate-binding protein